MWRARRGGPSCFVGALRCENQKLPPSPLPPAPAVRDDAAMEALRGVVQNYEWGMRDAACEARRRRGRTRTHSLTHTRSRWRTARAHARSARRATRTRSPRDMPAHAAAR
jgi:hypothetical protein